MVQEIITIGNSKGIRIPKPYLKELGNVTRVNLEIREDAQHQKRLVMIPVLATRSGWEAQFSEDDDLLIEDSLSNEFDADEWTW